MSTENITPSQFASVLDTDWEALIKRGTAQGSLTVDDVVRRPVSYTHLTLPTKA